MAKKFSIDVKRAEHQLIKPSDIKLPEFTGRKKRSDADILKRKADMLRDGQLQNVGIRKLGDGTVEAVFGITRILAGKLIEAEDKEFRLKCMVVDAEDAKAYALLTIRENVDRNALSDLDIAYDQHELREVHGMKNREIAEVFNCDPAKVTRLAKLLQLSDKVQNAVHEGIIASNAAIEMVELPHEEQDKLLAGGAHRQSDIIEYVRKWKEPKPQPAPQPVAQLATPTVVSVEAGDAQPTVSSAEAQPVAVQGGAEQQPAPLDFSKLGTEAAPVKPNQKNRQRTIQQVKDVISRYTDEQTNIVLRTFATALMAYTLGEIGEMQLEDIVRQIEGVKIPPDAAS